MNVLVVSTITRWSPLFETELELMQKHLDAGDHVQLLACEGELLACDDNYHHGYSRCAWCKHARDVGLSLLTQPIPTRRLLKLNAEQRGMVRGVRQDFKSLDELKAYRIDDFEIGYAVASSVISVFRDASLVTEDRQRLITRFMMSAMAVYHSVGNYLRESAVDRVYVFNPRFAATRAVFRACAAQQVPCYAHDRGRDLFHYVLCKDRLLHDREYVLSLIRDTWAKGAADPSRAETAEQFFTHRAEGYGGSWYSFTSEQKAGRLPEEWNHRQRNIVAFTSSEDEFAAIGATWTNRLYPKQVDGLQRIAVALQESQADVHFYVRVHPNLRCIDNEDTRQLRALTGERLTVIPPEDTVSTYALLRNADCVLTFGSTVGIEAVYWGVPSVLAGPSMYRELGGTYLPKDHESLIKLLLTDLSPMNRTAALMYGYYWSTFGVPYEYYKPTGVKSGKFKGTDIRRDEKAAALGEANREGTVGGQFHDLVRKPSEILFALRTRCHMTRRLMIHGR